MNKHANTYLIFVEIVILMLVFYIAMLDPAS
jgi:hypothetical protein